ncbi:MAG TPA: glycosyltransferase [Thermodesulfobacteriota bacterium]|nr:glycosyltransferase [Thermodesulfobacteriota bacterium]
MNGLRALASTDPASVFSLDLPLDLDLRNGLKGLQESLKIPWMIWFVDDPEGFDFPDCLDPDWTIVFCWDGEITRQISADGSWKGIPPIHLPLATDPEVFYPEGNGSPLLFPGGVFIGSTAHPNRFFDEAILNSPGFEEIVSTLWEAWKANLGQVPQEVVWGFLEGKTGIGLSTLKKDPLARLWAHSTAYALGRRKRRGIVSTVIGQGGGVFGDREWEQAVGNTYRGKVIYGEELRRIYLASAFVLETRQSQCRTGLTQRVFDASACGIPVLAEHSPELDEYFNPREEIFSFRTLEEALERKKNILFLQNHSPLAVRARNRVLAQHTYRHRAARILEEIQRFFAASRA